MRRLLVLIVVAAALAVLAGGAQGAGGTTNSTAGGGSDTIPPEPFIRARKRQDLKSALKQGIQTTCGTEDDERPVTCTMSASRRGKVLVTESDEIVEPFNRVQFHLEVSKKEKRRIRLAEPPIVIRLDLEVSDEAGNVGTATRKIKLVKDRFA